MNKRQLLISQTQSSSASTASLKSQYYSIDSSVLAQQLLLDDFSLSPKKENFRDYQNSNLNIIKSCPKKIFDKQLISQQKIYGTSSQFFLDKNIGNQFDDQDAKSSSTITIFMQNQERQNDFIEQKKQSFRRKDLNFLKDNKIWFNQSPQQRFLQNLLTDSNKKPPNPKNYNQDKIKKPNSNFQQKQQIDQYQSGIDLSPKYNQKNIHQNSIQIDQLSKLLNKDFNYKKQNKFETNLEKQSKDQFSEFNNNFLNNPFNNSFKQKNEKQDLNKKFQDFSTSNFQLMFTFGGGNKQVPIDKALLQKARKQMQDSDDQDARPYQKRAKINDKINDQEDYLYKNPNLQTNKKKVQQSCNKNQYETNEKKTKRILNISSNFNPTFINFKLDDENALISTNYNSLPLRKIQKKQLHKASNIEDNIKKLIGKPKNMKKLAIKPKSCKKQIQLFLTQKYFIFNIPTHLKQFCQNISFKSLPIIKNINLSSYNPKDFQAILHTIQHCNITNCFFCQTNYRQNQIQKNDIIQTILKVYSERGVLGKISQTMLKVYYDEVCFKLFKYKTYFPQIINKSCNPSTIIKQVYQKANQYEKGYLGYLNYCSRSPCGQPINLIVRQIVKNKYGSYFVKLSDGWTYIWAIFINFHNLLFKYVENGKIKVGMKIQISGWKSNPLKDVANVIPVLQIEKIKNQQVSCIQIFYNGSFILQSSEKLGKPHKSDIIYRPLSKCKQYGGTIYAIRGIVIRIIEHRKNFSKDNSFKHYIQLLTAQGKTYLMKFHLSDQNTLIQYFRLYFSYIITNVQMFQGRQLCFIFRSGKIDQIKNEIKNEDLLNCMKNRLITQNTHFSLIKTGFLYDFIAINGVFQHPVLGQIQTDIKRPMKSLYQQFQLKQSSQDKLYFSKGKYSNIVDKIPSLYQKLL